MRRPGTPPIACALAVAAVAMPLACNAITGISDYGTYPSDGSVADVRDSAVGDAPGADGSDPDAVAIDSSTDDSSVVDSADSAPFDAGSVTPGPMVTVANCTTATRGPTMVKFVAPGGDYCIDVTEVTMGQYYAFWKAAADGRATGSQRPACNFNDDFTPQYPSPGWADPALSGLSNAPVRYVDECDAVMYCTWDGKRLCSGIGGKEAGYQTENNDATKDQWYNVCSNGGTTDYPYGAAYTAGICNDSDTGGGVRNVGSSLGCKGTAPPFDAVFDMSGNVAEWEDSCEPGLGGLTNCRTRGGNYAALGGIGFAKCNTDTFQHRGAGTSVLGFRCCTR